MWLAIDVTGPAVTVEAVNDTTPSTTGDHRMGQGIIGMQERAAAAGGRLQVITDDGRFQIRAELPTMEGAQQ